MHETLYDELLWPGGDITLEPDAMGRVLVDIEVVNASDEYRAHEGSIAEDDVRRVGIADALVDTGCSTFALHQHHVDELGLSVFGRTTSTTAGGPVEISLYGPCRLYLQGRSLTMDCYVVPDDVPVLIGQVPLQHMGFLVDPGGHRPVAKPPGGSEQKPEREPIA